MFFRICIMLLCFITLTARPAPQKAVQPAVQSIEAAAPKPSDRDNDGIPDSMDRCPDAAETVNGYQDDDGCPDEIPPVLTFRNIHFALNSADIIDDAKGDLDVGAQIMTHDLKMRVRIEGHTDSYGTASYNLDLSKRRAESVKVWLVQKYGIDADRIQTAGFGYSRPIGSLSSSEGRKASRRVEFVILERGK